MLCTSTRSSSDEALVISEYLVSNSYSTNSSPNPLLNPFSNRCNKTHSLQPQPPSQIHTFHPTQSIPRRNIYPTTPLRPLSISTPSSSSPPSPPRTPAPPAPSHIPPLSPSQNPYSPSNYYAPPTYSSTDSPAASAHLNTNPADHSHSAPSLSFPPSPPFQSRGFPAQHYSASFVLVVVPPDAGRDLCRLLRTEECGGGRRGGRRMWRGGMPCGGCGRMRDRHRG